METTFVVGNMAWNAGLVAVAGWLTKRWMDKVDARADRVHLKVEATAKEIADNLKESVSEHKAELKEQSEELTSNLAKIYDQLRVANGRTAKIEGKVDVQIAVCAERTKNDECRRRATD